MTSHASRKTEGRGRLYDSVVDTIGNTPCIRLNRIAPKHVRMYVKAEFFNPAGSVKDRLAISIIEEAERRGAIGRRLHLVALEAQDEGERIRRIVVVVDDQDARRLQR